MKKQNILSALFMMCLMLVGSVAFTGCGTEDDLDTNQFKPAVSLNVFGPSPVARGGQLRFIGTGLDQVTEVIFPGGANVTEITKVNEREIQVTVPQDAEPGKVTLKYAGGEIVTKTVLAYTEPVGFDESEPFNPNPVKPGHLFAIKGEYLNLVTSIFFTDNVVVSQESFQDQSRKQIIIEVPYYAQTGKVAISFCATGDTIPNIIYSEQELQVVLPSVAEVMDIKGSKPGDVITIKGNDLDLVRRVVMPNDEEVEFEAIDEKVSGIKFTLPASISTGYIRVVPASGVEVVVANNGVAEPAELVATPNTELHEGDIITITGKNLDVVTSATFPSVADTIALEKGGTATEIQVKAPAGFTSGELLLNTGYGVSFPVAIATAKPALESYNPQPVSAGNEMTINGKDLDLIAKVTFADDLPVTDFIAQSATSLTLKVPATAKAGDLTITMKNKEEVTFAAPQIDAPEFCFIPEMPNLDETKAGDLLIVTVVNSDKLIGVKIDGEDCQFINMGETIYIGIPVTAGMSSKMVLVSSNGEIEYNLPVIPATEQTFVLWTGAADLAGWSWNWQIGDGSQGANNPKMFVDMGLQVDDVIRVWCTNYNDWWQVQFFDGHWNGQTEIGVATGLNNGNNINAGIYDLAANGGYIAIPATATLVEQLTTLNDWGYCWIMQGEGVIVNKIDVLRKIELGTVLLKGPKAVGCLDSKDWTFDAIDGGYDWSQAQPGQKLIIEAHRLPDADYSNFKLIDPWWAVQIACFFTEEGIEDNDTTTRVESKTFEIVLTADMIEAFATHGGCGVGGHGSVIDKVVLK